VPAAAARLTLPVLGLAVALVLGTAPPAVADPLGDAHARAQALQRELDGLQQQADVAVQQYDAAQEAFARAVTQRLTSERGLDAASRSAGDARRASDERARALYKSGGSSALFAGVLSSADPVEALTRWHAVTTVLSADQARAARSAAGVGPVAQAQRRAQAAAATQTRRTQQEQEQAAHVQDLLQRQQALIAGADAEVLRLAREQQERERHAAERAFAERVAAAEAPQARAEAAGAAAASADVRALGATTVRRSGSGARPLPAPVAGGPGPGGAAPGGAVSVAAPGTAAERAVAAARSRLGLPYRWGATGPEAFDCSGLTGWAYAAAGVTLPRVAAEQYNAGPHPGLAELAPGDLLFWGSSSRSIHHVALYLGDGMMIAAPHTGDVVKMQRVYASGFLGATRVA